MAIQTSKSGISIAQTTSNKSPTLVKGKDHEKRDDEINIEWYMNDFNDSRIILMATNNCIGSDNNFDGTSIVVNETENMLLQDNMNTNGDAWARTSKGNMPLGNNSIMKSGRDEALINVSKDVKYLKELEETDREK